MYTKLLKQILWASAFLALAFFLIDIYKLYLEFTPDKFKLSIATITIELSLLLATNIIKSIVLISPLILLSFVFSLSKSFAFYKFCIGLNSIVYFLISSISLCSYFLETIFSEHNLKDLIDINIVNGVNLKFYFYSLLSILVIVCLIIFRGVKSKRAFEDEKRTIFAFFISALLLGVTYYEVTTLKKIEQSIKSTFNHIEQLLEIREKNTTLKVNYKEEFKKYLGLEDIYESEKNYLKLLIRKTGPKEIEHNVVFLYVDSLDKDELIASISKRLFTFTNVTENFNDPLKSIRYIMLDLPASVKNIPSAKDHIMSSYYLNSFKGYKSYNETSLTEHSDEKYISFIHLNRLGDQDYLKLNKMIESNSDNTVFVITTNSSVLNTDVVTIDNYLDRSTFISFHIPKSLGSIDYKKDKRIGQEDIMTTLYNLALNQREYLSLGDDIFIDSISNGINEEFCIDESGVYLTNTKLDRNEKKVNLIERCDSTKNIADFIVNQSLIKD